MKQRFDMRIIFGIVLIIAGALFLLDNLGIFNGGVNILWAAILGGAGITLFYLFANNRNHWWALIPGSTLLAVALNITMGMVSHQLSDILSGGIILGGIGLGFWLIFLTNRNFWWALIPAGVLSSLAFVSVLGNFFATGGLFLVGLGLTFILLALLPGYEDQLKWGYIPGGILLLIGIMTMPILGNIFNILWPLALIGAGGYVIYKNLKN